MNNLISVLIPTFNRADLIAQTLDCVLEQTYENWECIIVDDSSSDYTEELINFYTEKDNRFKFYKRPESYKEGAASCRNYAFHKSKGDYIQYIDSDDLLSSNKFALQVNQIQDKEDTVITCSWGFFENSISNEEMKIFSFFEKIKYEPIEIFQKLGHFNSYLPVHSYLTPRTLLKKVGSWNEELTNNDDAEFFTRILLNSNKVIVVKEAIAYYRKYQGENISSYSSLHSVNSAIKSWELIENHFRAAYDDRSILYLTVSKKRLFNNISWENPGLIIEHSKFFQKQILEKRKEQRWKVIKRLWRRMRKRLGFYEI